MSPADTAPSSPSDKTQQVLLEGAGSLSICGGMQNHGGRAALLPALPLGNGVPAPMRAIPDPVSAFASTRPRPSQGLFQCGSTCSLVLLAMSGRRACRSWTTCGTQLHTRAHLGTTRYHYRSVFTFASLFSPRSRSTSPFVLLNVPDCGWFLIVTKAVYLSACCLET